VQYSYNHNYPSEAARTGIEFILFVAPAPQFIVSWLMPPRFSGCWTTLVASGYLFLFLHPKLSKTPIASIGVQGIWICLTWILWIAAAAYLNAALPFVTVYSQCTLVYCGQLKALFGKCSHVTCVERINQRGTQPFLLYRRKGHACFTALHLIHQAEFPEQHLLRVGDVRDHVARVAKGTW